MSTTLVHSQSQSTPKTRKRPRLGFLGVGWIGKHRLQAIAQSGLAEISAVADSSPELARQAATATGTPAAFSSLDELLGMELDGVVIATPSALHAEQAIAALERGAAVFCQKPLGRNAEETRRVVQAARSSDCLLGVDLSYRYLAGTEQIHELCSTGNLGCVYAADLVFHNAYGPDKPWFYDRKLSGGGCVLDLGIHLIDLALWNFRFPEVVRATCRLYARGRLLSDPADASRVEDYAEALIELAGGLTVRIACSWNLSAGQDAVIRGAFYGTKGSAEFRNVNGSFYEFVAERFDGRTRQPLSSGAEEWGGRAAVQWVRSLAAGLGFQAEAEHLVQVAEALDAIYQSGLGAQTVSRNPDQSLP